MNLVQQKTCQDRGRNYKVPTSSPMRYFLIHHTTTALWSRDLKNNNKNVALIIYSDRFFIDKLLLKYC